MRRIIPLIVLALALLAGCGGSLPLRGAVIEPARPAFDFTLTDEAGQPFTLSAQRGRVVLLYFGFTACPDVCPTTLVDLSKMMEQLGDDAGEVTVALVTLDPERDSIAQLNRYVTAFDPRFKGLRGEVADLMPIAEAYGVSFARRDLPGSALVYTIDHSAFIYVIDRAGRWREVFAYGSPVEDLVADVRALARERVR